MLHRRAAAALAVVSIAAVAAPAWAIRSRTAEPPAPSAGATAAPGVTTAAGVLVDDALDQHLTSTAPTDLLRVFVHASDSSSARAAATRAGLSTAYELRRVGVVAASGPAVAVQRLTQDSTVSYVEADRRISFQLDHTHRSTRGEEARRAFQKVPAPTKVRYGGKAMGKRVPFTPAFREEIDGRGVSVAIIDSGVDGSHPFFTRPDGTSQVRRNLRQTCEDIELAGPTEGVCAAAGIDGIFVDAPGNDSDTMANGGHGTHVAGIVGGVDVELGDGRKLHGAAPGADLIALGTGRALFISGAVPALEWVLENHADPCGDGSCAPIRVINNSWSSDHDYVADDVVNKLQRALIAEGVTVVWAASNDGGDGNEKLTNGYGQEPTPGSVMVANYDDGNTGSRDGALDESSSRGLKGSVDTYPDVSAPGALVLSSCRAYLPVCSTGLEVVENGDYNSISGTSMAAPHIAGIVAQLLQVNPKLTPAAIEDLLEDTAHRFAFGGRYEPDLADRNPDSLTSFDKGHGLVDVVAAVARLLGVAAPGAPVDCIATGPVATDPSGDATGVLGVPAAPNEPSLDVTALSLDSAGDQLVATVTVDELGATPAPSTGEGEYFDVNFTHDARKFFLAASRNVDGTEAFDLGWYDTTRSGIDDVGVTGSFDPATSTVTIRLPFAATADDAAGVRPLAAGEVLSSIQVVSRRQIGGAVPDADTADAACGYTIGVGNGTPPATATPDDQPDTTLARGGPAYTYSGAVTTGASDPTGLGGIVGLDEVMASGDGTVVKLVQVADAGHLKVTLTSDMPADFDLEVLDARGQVVGTSGVPGSDELVEADVAPGNYRVIVRTFAAVEATFTATASLS